MGIFNIGGHILSRMNGGLSREFKEIAKKLGEYGLVDKTFVENKLIKMAGYRNRLTHFYADIDPKELYQIVQSNLDDFEFFLSEVKNILKDPKKFGLEIE